MIPQKSRIPSLRVSLLIDRAAGQFSELLVGIAEFIRVKRTWIVQRRNAVREREGILEGFRPDGVLAVVMNGEMAEQLVGLGVPLLNVGGEVDWPGMPRLGPDYKEVGRLQVMHLIARGHSNLVWVGDRSHWYSLQHLEGIRRACQTEKVSLSGIDLLDLYNPSDYTELDRSLTARLSTMHLPFAVLTGHAEDAERVAQRCHELDLDIPEQVAIVTVDDDAVSGALAYPGFTTVDVPWRRIGYQGADLLDRMIRGEDAPEAMALPVSPTGITERRSTESIALNDPQLARAVVYIRQHAGEKVLVEDIARAAGLSRRLMEDRFRRHLGHSPFREIRHHQVHLVRQFLLETDLPLEEVCDHTAFAYLSHMTKAFREEFGMAPGAYRKQYAVR